MITLLLSGWLMGFLGSVHCLGMCGGIAGALSMTIPASALGTRLARNVGFSSGRIVSYTLAGAVVGTVGLAVAEAAGPTGRIVLRSLAALLLLGVGLQVGGWSGAMAGVEGIGAGIWRKIAPWAARLRPGSSLARSILWGGVWGWLPCGLVYSALAVAATSATPASGAAVMAAFGLGTLPAMVAMGTFAHQAMARARSTTSRRLAGGLLVAFAVWTLAGSGVAERLWNGGSPPPCCHEGEAGGKP